MFALSFLFMLQVLEKGHRFTMRAGKSTLGYGVITELLPDIDLEAVEERRKMEKRAKKKKLKEEQAAKGY